jgi:hypothetical protein
VKFFGWNRPSPETDTELRTALDDFEEAVRGHEMMGAGDPADHDFIETNYRSTKEKLIEVLARLCR